ncbi:uncharacterized protein LOC115989329 [Quercus lobata]|uniref:uncharacterized protein LOC115989329 n=1 Tax=Quercus lobata TaxID=97700 RepID=UPI001246A8F3|nr:uncharacterized protein LOC115989329 [Quercus lobata]
MSLLFFFLGFFFVFYPRSCTAVFVLLRAVVHFLALPTSVVRLTGVGDCLVGGMLASICAGLNLIQSVVVGIAAAKAVVEAETSVPTAFSLASIAGKTEVGAVIGVAGKD